MNGRAGLAWIALALLVGVTATCADLRPMTGGVCGNGVVEDGNGEDCDLYASDPGTRCGSPGSSGKCRWVCGPAAADGAGGGTAAPTCPTGWACGVDGICRQPSGRFELAWTQPFPNPPVLAAGDFDGDGRTDLVTTHIGETEIHYLGAKGAVESTLRLRPSLRAPATGRLTADDLSDLAVNYDALSVERGRPDRTLSPTSYSPFALPLANVRAVLLDALPAQVNANGGLEGEGDEILLLGDVTRDGGSVTVVVAGGVMAGASQELHDFNKAFATDIAGKLQAGNIAEQSPCDEVVVSIVGEKQIRIVTPCAPDGQGGWTWNSPGSPDDTGWTVALPVDPQNPAQSGGVKDGVLLADLNFDGHLDLLISTTDWTAACPTNMGSGGGGAGGLGPAGGAGGTSAGGGPGVGGSGGGMVEPNQRATLFVAYGVGDGTFHSDLAHIPAAGGDGQAAPVCGSALPSLPLAAADLNGDHRIDFVTPAGLLLSLDGPAAGAVDQISYRVATYNDANDWTVATAADFNGDGLLDVAAISKYRPMLGFLNGAGNGLFNPYLIPLPANPTDMAVGDFDGDRLLDIALAENGPHATSGQTGQGGSGGTMAMGNEGGSSSNADYGDSLSVAFGNAFGAPSAPLSMGQFARIQSVVAGNVMAYGYPEGLSDLVTVSQPEQGDSWSLALLLGTSTRQLVSPYRFVRQASNGMDTPASVTIGQFDGDPSHLDMTAISYHVPRCSAINGGPAEGGRADDPSKPQPDALWLLPSTGEAAVEPGAAKFVELPKDFDGLGALIGRADLDGDGIEELVLLSSTIDPDSQVLGSQGKLLVLHAEQDSGYWRWPKTDQMVGQDTADPFSVGADRPGCGPTTSAGSGGSGGAGGGPPTDQPPDRTVATVLPNPLTLLDVDGDGAKDVVALSRVGADDGQGNSSWDIFVFLNDGHGHFAGASGIAIKRIDGELPYAFAFVHTSASGPPDIAVATAAHVYVGHLVLQLDANPQQAVVEVTQTLPLPGQTPSTQLDLVAADFDGDGVDDIALSWGDGLGLSPSEVDLFLGVPVRP